MMDHERDAATVAPATAAASATETTAPGHPLKRFLRILGPGFTTGASDDDPSGIGTYASVGAARGYVQLWTAVATFPLQAGVQYTCAKIGLVAGQGLAGVLRSYYPRRVLYPAVFLLVLANTINAGTDIGAIAAGVDLVVPVPIAVLIAPIAFGILALQLLGTYRLIARVFKWLTLALFAYVGAAFFAHPDWSAVLRGTLVPTMRVDAAYLMALVAILGTTISPYLFFWQASQEVEEEVSEGRLQLWQRRGATDAELRFAGWDVGVGMFFCNLVFYFVILTTAATLHAAGTTDIDSAAAAARALDPLAGRGAEVLFALGLIGSGFLAVPILTGAAAFAVAEAFGWPCSLDARPRQAMPFYAVIAASTLVGMLVNFVGINPIQALYWTAVLNGLLAPPLLALIWIIANNHAVMQDRTNGWRLNALIGITTGVMTATAVALVATWL